MKKLLLFLTTFLLSVGMVFADSFFYGVETPNKTVAPGDTVELHYTLWCPAEGIEDYDFNCSFDYDPDILEYIDDSYVVTDGWEFEPHIMKDNFRGHISVADFYGAMDPETIAGFKAEDCEANKYVILTAKFKVKEDVKNTETKVFALMEDMKGDSSATIKVYKKSNDTSLKSLSVDDTTIKIVEGATSFDLAVPYDSDAVTIKYACNGINCVVSDNGKLQKQLEVGKNTVDFTVKAEDGTEKKYTLNINRQSPNKDATINYISIKQSGNYGYLDIDFKEDQYTYDFTVPYEVTFVTTNAECKGEKCEIYYSEVTELDEGLNSIHITVVAQSGDENEYVINIERDKKPEEVPVITPEPTNKDNTKLLTLIVSLICILLIVAIILLTKKKKNTPVTETPVNDEPKEEVVPEVEEVTPEEPTEVEEETEKETTKEFNFKETNEYKEEE